MRSEFCNAMVELASDPNLLFLTDLGFMALEPLESALGERFINAGVSEQNMVSVAAAMTTNAEDALIVEQGVYFFYNMAWSPSTAVS